MNLLNNRLKKTKNWLSTLERRASSAGVALEDSEGRALVVKAYYKQYWSFPGGIIDSGETPLQAAIRESREEVGVTIDASTLAFCFVVNRASQIAQTYQFVFGGSISESEKQSLALDGKEIDAYEFVSKEQILAGDRPYSQSTVLWAQGFTGGYSEQAFTSAGSQPIEHF